MPQILIETFSGQPQNFNPTKISSYMLLTPFRVHEAGEGGWVYLQCHIYMHKAAAGLGCKRASVCNSCAA